MCDPPVVFFVSILLMFVNSLAILDIWPGNLNNKKIDDKTLVKFNVKSLLKTIPLF